MTDITEALTFDDVLLEVQYSEVESRSRDVSVKTSLGNLKLDLPIISSPMDTVTTCRMAAAMQKSGGLGIIHRYLSLPLQVEQVGAAWHQSVVDANGNRNIGAAVGVSGDYLDRVRYLTEAGANVICVDVAHGHHVLVKRALTAINQLHNRDKIHVMAGNVATVQGYLDLASWGADSVRVGIGSGSICSTRINTGHGMPNFHVLRAIHAARMLRHNGVIRTGVVIDGGIRNGGDINKALAAGADAVMCGSMLAGTDEAPGEIVDTEQGKRKVYRGMASQQSQVEWRGKSSPPEGISATVPYKGSVLDVLATLKGYIEGGCSYSGVRSIPELQEKAKWVRQTQAGQIESSTHVLRL